MTREEIIEQLDGIVGTYEILIGHGVNSDILDVDDIEAIREAISVLSAEPCGDCISRQAVLDAIQNLNIPEDMCVFEIISHIEVAIATLPPVENKED